MRVENISTNQPRFEGKSYKSIFKSFTNLFSKSKNEQTEKAFETLASTSAASAMAAIAINKKQESSNATSKSSANEELKFGENLFNENIPDLPKISDKEFEDLKKRVYADERSRYVAITYRLTPQEEVGRLETQLVAKILDNEDLYNNEKVRKYADKTIFPKQPLTQEQAKVINYVLSNKRLYDGKYVMEDTKRALPSIDKSNVNFVLKVLSDERLTKAGFECCASLLEISKGATHPQEILKSANDVIDKYLSNQALYNNKNITRYLPFIASGARNSYGAKQKNSIFDMYANSQELQNQQHVSKQIGNIALVVDDENIDLATRILANPILYKNKYLFDGTYTFSTNKIIDVLGHADTLSKTQYMNKVLDVYLSDKELYTNENLNKALSRILERTDKNNVNYRTSILQMYSNNKALQNGAMSEKIGDLILNAHTDLEFKIADKVLRDEKLYNNKIILNKIPDIVGRIGTPEEAEYISKLLDIDNVVTDEEIVKNIPLLESRMKFGSEKALNKRLKILNMVLDNKELHQNKLLLSELPDIINGVRFTEQVDIANIVLNNSKYYNNEQIIKKLPQWIKGIDGMYQVNKPFYREIKAKLEQE